MAARAAQSAAGAMTAAIRNLRVRRRGAGGAFAMTRF
jgi:hypothetical protein